MTLESVECFDRFHQFYCITCNYLQLPVITSLQVFTVRRQNYRYFVVVIIIIIIIIIIIVIIALWLIFDSAAVMSLAQIVGCSVKKQQKLVSTQAYLMLTQIIIHAIIDIIGIK